MLRSRRTALLAGLVAAALALSGCGNASLRAGTLGGDTADTASAATAPTVATGSTDGGAPDSIVDEPEPVDSKPALDTAPDPVADTAADSLADPPADPSADPRDTTASSTMPANRPMEPSAADCPDTERGAVVYRPIQRGMLCEDGAIAYVFPVTTGRVVPKPGEFVVSSRNTWVRSTVGGHISTMTNFVAFTKKSPRIAFHSVPKTLDGKWVQPLSSVGSLKKWGASSGCIRVLPKDSKRIWNFLRNGDKVRIID